MLQYWTTPSMTGKLHQALLKPSCMINTTLVEDSKTYCIPNESCHMECEICAIVNHLSNVLNTNWSDARCITCLFESDPSVFFVCFLEALSFCSFLDVCFQKPRWWNMEGGETISEQCYDFSFGNEIYWWASYTWKISEFTLDYIVNFCSIYTVFYVFEKG